LTTSVAFGADLKVLELGCGAGIPGIVAGLLGAKQVDFQVHLDVASVANIRLVASPWREATIFQIKNIYK
jgi:predicted nicotinamide N-methyase